MTIPAQPLRHKLYLHSPSHSHFVAPSPSHTHTHAREYKRTTAGGVDSERNKIVLVNDAVLSFMQDCWFPAVASMPSVCACVHVFACVCVCVCVCECVFVCVLVDGVPGCTQRHRSHVKILWVLHPETSKSFGNSYSFCAPVYLKEREHA
jgi:hypothetical protein